MNAARHPHSPSIRRPARRAAAHPAAGHSRRGAVLVVILALLALLALIGITFYTFASQEDVSSQYYADAAKRNEPMDEDTLFDFALEQLILGADDRYPHSPFWGRMISLVPNLVGRLDLDTGQLLDRHPHSGRGRNIGFFDADGDGIPDDFRFFIDNEFNNTPTPDSTLRLNFSRAANPGGMPPELIPGTPQHYSPDVDYTYPDHNNLFLAYVGRPYSDAGPDLGRRVIIPSFHRPQLLRSRLGQLPTGETDNDWATHPLYADVILRPHPDHAAMAWNETLQEWVDSGLTRFLSTPVNGVNPFLFEVDVDENGLPNEQGIWTVNPVTGELSNTWEYDVDARGTGVRDAILMDLDFPIQELPDGRSYVPLFAYFVLDADGLINLNLHGNLNSLAGVADPTRFASRSNQGLTAAEINSARALYADPGTAADPATAFRQHMEFYGTAPANAVSLSNMELGFLSWGRPHWDSNGSIVDLFAGRWGERSLLMNAVNNNGPLPAPGRTGIDDNNSRTTGGTGSLHAQLPWFDPLLPNLPIPASVHPLDFRGDGLSHLQDMTGAVRARVGLSSDPQNPSQWIFYQQGYESTVNPSNPGIEEVRYRTAGDQLGNLFPAPSGVGHPDIPSGLVDEGAEVVVDPNFRNPDDDVFGPDELFALHASDSDFSNTGASSRLRRLAPFNFENSDQAAEIRRQFTTESWDRRQFGLRAKNPLDTNDPSKRKWEFNWIVNGQPSFPPVFGPEAARILDDNPLDPFRPEVRRLLRVSLDNADLVAPQRRLNINRLLHGFDGNGNPIYRHLTPHPTWDASDPNTLAQVPPMVHLNDAPPAFPFPPAAGNKIAQEWWARYDRQRLARDIYVLLYTLGGGLDGIDDGVLGVGRNYAEQPAPYTEAQCREMAQFAVNYVDALDRDSVITRFDYDTDLSTGWDPTGAVVFGVEQQTLTFSEALVIRTPEYDDQTEVSHPRTLYDETLREHYFLYIELRNASPFPVPLATQSVTDKSRAIWRIRRDNENGNAIYFLNDADPAPEGIPAGGQFTIAASDGDDFFDDGSGQRRPSDFRVAWDDSDPESFRLIAPAVPELPAGPPRRTTPNGQGTFWPMTDLDLVHMRDEGKFELEFGGIGGFLDSLSPPPDPATLTLVLERRPHNLPPGQLDQEPIEAELGWIEVDRIQVPIRDFALASEDTTQPLIEQKLQPLESQERVEALTRLGEGPYNANPPDLHQKNTIGRPRNSRTEADFTLWQPHFDRDFASPIELLSIPLYGPTQLLDELAEGAPPFLRMTGRKQGTDPEIPGGVAGVQKFLRPDPRTPQLPPLPPLLPDPQENRWYRLFEFVEVEPRAHAQVPSRHARIPGRVNLSTLRHPHVLAALIDDDVHLPLIDPGTGEFPDNHPSEPRRWWTEFLRARDREDPLTGFFLPGLPASRPFRNFAFVERGRQSLEDTLLRSLRMDVLFDGPLPRQLFEARTRADLGDMGNQANLVDYHTRHRLLSKVANNSTNRSNVFLVWITVQFHEAIEQEFGDSTVVQIGDRLMDVPSRRGFFVVDRTRLEEAFDPNTRTFDFRTFVTFRKAIE